MSAGSSSRSECNARSPLCVPSDRASGTIPSYAPRTSTDKTMNRTKILHETKIFLVMLLVICSLRSALADWNDVPTGSMKPTIEEGDRVVVNKLAYDLKVPFTTFEVLKWGDPQRGDIVVLFSPVDGTRLVKRVIGVPGDRIEMRDNQLFVNGRPAQWKEISTHEDSEQGSSLVVEENLAGRLHR